jgi:hypothetical protein
MGSFTSSHVEAASTLAVIASSNEPLLFLLAISGSLPRALRFAERSKLTRRACRGVSFPNSAQANGRCQS